MRVLVVEDDESVVGALSAVLLHHGFQLAVAQTAEAAFDLLDDSVDIVLLDLGLPDRDGIRACGQIRAASDAGIIIVTARDDLQSRVQGLDLGADDYIVKPYDSRELLARINAVVRRRAASAAQKVSAPQQAPAASGQLELDPARHVVRLAGVEIALTRREFEIVHLLLRHPGLVCRYQQIICELWGDPWPGAMRTLQVHIAAIRNKFGTADVIDTVRGVGYRIRDD